MGSEMCIRDRFRLGRQLADHFDSDSEMLWVQIPLELLKNNRHKQSAGKKKTLAPLHHTPARYANGRAAIFKTWWLKVRILSALLEKKILRVGEHWRAKLAVNQWLLQLCRFDSYSTHSTNQASTREAFITQKRCGWARSQPSLISLERRVRPPDPLLSRAVRQTVRHLFCKQEIGVRFSDGPLNLFQSEGSRIRLAGPHC